MDAVIRYLPSPLEVDEAEGRNKENGELIKRKPDIKEKLCALAFKVVSDKEKGLVTFVRVYSGLLKNKSSLLNTNLEEVEKVAGLLKVKADEA